MKSELAVLIVVSGIGLSRHKPQRNASNKAGCRAATPDNAQRRLDHLTAIVDLGHDPVGTVVFVSRNRDLGPLDGHVMAGEVGQDVAAAVLVLAGDDEAGLVGVLAGAGRRVDGDDDAHQVGEHEPIGARAASIRARFHSAPGTSSSSSAFSSWRPSRVPSYFLMICATKAGARLAAFL